MNKEKLYCQYCNKECKNLNSLKQHENFCHCNPNRKIKIAWNKGLNKETDIRVKKNIDSYKNNYMLGLHKSTSHPHSTKTKEKLSKIRTQAILNGVNAGFKDVKYYKIKNILNKEFNVRGAWELFVAQYLNSQNILWECRKYLSYHKNNILKHYIPDFYLPETNEYIEVKGYFSEENKNKMNLICEQYRDIKIIFINSEWYKKLSENKCKLKDIPYYKFTI